MAPTRTICFWVNVSQAPCAIQYVIPLTPDLLLDGFFLDENRDDCIYLDDIVFRDLDAEKQEELQLHQYYG